MKYLNLLFALGLGLLITSSCSDNDEPLAATNTIVDIAAADAQFSTLVSALQRTGLDATLAGTGTFTVFAPTNAAFDALGVDLATLSDTELSNILLYHVLGASVRAGDIASGNTYVSTASASGPGGHPLTLLVEGVNGGVRLNGTINVTTADIVADNGVIHVVDQVIMPLNIVGHAVANANFSALVDALGSAPGDLVSVLSGDGPFTVFAPINTAFDEIATTVASLTPDQLASVLTYHVIGASNIKASDLSTGAEVMAVNGQIVTVDLSGGPQLVDVGGNTSNIIVTDVQATNGVIHAIDKVIIPAL